MCGRYTLTLPLDEVARYLAARESEVPEPPLARGYNIAPSQRVPIVMAAVASVAEPDPRRLLFASWGFEIAGGKSRPINARAETVAIRAPFRNAFAAGRCLVPVSGFFEWDSVRGTKRPYYVRPRDCARSPLMVLAGIATRTKGGASCAILTRPATAALAKIHDRMPLILASSQIRDWLRGDVAAARAVLLAATERAAFDLSIHEVSDRVNDARADGPEIIAPISSERS